MNKLGRSLATAAITFVEDRGTSAGASPASPQKQVKAPTAALNRRTITWNLKHFDSNEPTKVGIVAEDPDAFLCRLLAESPENIVGIHTNGLDHVSGSDLILDARGDDLEIHLRVGQLHRLEPRATASSALLCPFIS